MADAPPQSLDLQSLAQRFGLPAALQLLALLDPQGSAISKALSGTNLAAGGAQAAGNLTGVSGLGQLGKGLGAAAGVGAGAYGAYKAATDPNLSQTQRVGHSGRSIADTIMSLLIPYYGLAKAASVVGDVLQRSKSPQVRGTGRAVGQVAEPSGAKAFWDVAQGDLSPKAAAKRYGFEGAMYDTMGPLGAVLKGAGVKLPFLSHTPTHGTIFRGALQNAFKKEGITGIKDWKGSDFTTDMFNKYPNVQARDAATKLGQMFTQGYQDKRAPDYAIQTQNVLLNNLPPEVILGLAQKYGVQA
jgi:hypothetical protein